MGAMVNLRSRAGREEPVCMAELCVFVVEVGGIDLIRVIPKQSA